jgi:peptidoglycan/LPS O-acetylase OafA/YrhL
MRYRADIDGLRAIAVSAVVLFHAFPTLLPGGFIGVDVFFVISGFLITSLIIGQVNAGDFTYLQFYKRRLLRLTPAFVVVGLTSLGTAFFLYAPSEFEGLAKSLVAAVLLHANHHFYSEAGYFGAPMELTPMLHMWSLSVEEQFYLIFPVCLVWFLRKPGRAMTVLVATTGLSFVASCAFLFVDSEAAFFLLPFRAWELLLGALLAISGYSFTSFHAQRWGAIGGLALIAGSSLLLTKASSFPGWNALWPCLGALLVIAAGPKGGSAIGLASKPFNYLGRISYSLYLWHWPVLVFSIYHLARPLTDFEGAAAVFVSVALASLTLHCIENPFRRGAFGATKLVVSMSGATAVLAVALVVDSQNGSPWRLPAPYGEMLSANSMQIGMPRQSCRLERLVEEDARLAPFLEAPGVRICRIGDRNALPTVVIWGDSIGDALAPGLNDPLISAHQSGYSFAKGGCPPLLNVERSDSPKWRCKAFNDAAAAVIESIKPSLLAISSRWPYQIEGTRFKHETGPGPHLEGYGGSGNREVSAQAIPATVAWASKQAKQLVVIGPIPEFGTNVSAIIGRRALAGETPAITVSRTELSVRQATTWAILKRSVKETDAILIDPTDAFCGPDVCEAVIGDRLVFADGSHPSSQGSEVIYPLFADILHHNL